MILRTLILGLIWLLIFGPFLPLAAEAACTGTSPTWTCTADFTSLNNLFTLNDPGTVQNGDTVNVSANSGAPDTWTSVLDIQKCVTLKGAGIDQTIIRDGVLSGSLLIFRVQAACNSKLEGFTFNNNGRTVTNTTGIIIFQGVSGATDDGRRMIATNNKFDHLNGVNVLPNRIYGVVANNTFLGANNITFVYVLNTGSPTWADARWAEAPNFGGENFLFIEHNTMTHDAGASSTGTIDSQGGNRVVVRYNAFTRGQVEFHGTESVGRTRGTSASEVYNNTFDNTSCGGCNNTAMVGLRSGVSLVWGNTATNYPGVISSVNLAAQRFQTSFNPWSWADGRNPWDNNNAANPIVPTRTVTSSGTLTVTDSTANFGNLVGYSIRKTSASCNTPITATSGSQFTAAGHGLVTGNGVAIVGYTGSTPVVSGNYTVTVVDANTFTLNGVTLTAPGSGGWVSKNAASCNSLIRSNTATTITFENSFSGGATALSFTAGDTFEIDEITQILDQPAVSQGANLNGATIPAYPVGGMAQVITPIYEWNNTDDATDIDVGVSAAYSRVFLSGTHYFNDTQMPGYTPYTDPHPLAAGGSPGPPDVQKRSRVGNGKFGGVRVQ